MRLHRMLATMLVLVPLTGLTPGAAASKPMVQRSGCVAGYRSASCGNDGETASIVPPTIYPDRVGPLRRLCPMGPHQAGDHCPTRCRRNDRHDRRRHNDRRFKSLTSKLASLAGLEPATYG